MKNYNELKIIGYTLIIVPISFILFANIYNIQIEKEASIIPHVVSLYFLFKQIYKLDKNK